MYKKVLTTALFCVIIYGILFLAAWYIPVRASIPVNKRIVVIDAGHGEWDPGKTNAGVSEKDINLKIAVKLQMLLEMGGSVVFVTRADDTALADKKREDLKNRAAIANAAGADIYVSIHQNAFESSSVSGAQVFYHSSSEQSKILAGHIQNQFNEFLDSSKKREAKSSETYYVLKTTDMPAVIVECGFMSNPAEFRMLQDEGFQDKIAWVIYMGIAEYFGENKAPVSMR